MQTASAMMKPSSPKDLHGSQRGIRCQNAPYSVTSVNVTASAIRLPPIIDFFLSTFFAVRKTEHIIKEIAKRSSIYGYKDSTKPRFFAMYMMPSAMSIISSASANESASADVKFLYLVVMSFNTKEERCGKEKKFFI
jgi:cytosine/uracil/thiamine/allantoin permease